jgi:hypothetical protein
VRVARKSCGGRRSDREQGNMDTLARELRGRLTRNEEQRE